MNSITDNIINENSTIINNKNNGFKKITPQQSFYSKLDRKKIPVLLSQMMKDFKKKNSNENCLKIIYSSNVLDLYLKCGYEVIGEEFIEAGIKHFPTKKVY